MRVFFSILVCLALGLVGLVQAAYNDEMFHNQGKALVEVWIGRAAVNVGDVTGQDMYDVMQNDLHQLCPGDGSAGSSCIWRNGKYPTHHVEEVKSKPNEPWVIRDSVFSYMVSGTWNSEEERRLLVHTMADTLRVLTLSDKNSYWVPGQAKKFANVPDFIRINLPADGAGKESGMHLNLDCTGKLAGQKFWCCPSRKDVDKVIDYVGGNYKALFMGKDFSRDVRCLINHMTTCEDCGSKCDSCGYRCDDVCPKGKC